MTAMSQQLSAFDGQEHEQPSAEHPEGRKVVFDDDAEPDVPTLPDGRFDGEGEWTREAVKAKVWRDEDLTHNIWAMWMLYNGSVTRRQFADETDAKFGRPSFKLPARIADLRQMDDTPPIRTDEEPEETEWHIPQADTDR